MSKRQSQKPVGPVVEHTSTDFSKPTTVTDADIAFGGGARRLMPKWEDIPGKYHRGRGHAATIFFRGGRIEAEPKEGVDHRDAIRHLQVILGSYAPKHEHKEAAVDYLIDLWFDEFRVVEEGGK